MTSTEIAEAIVTESDDQILRRCLTADTREKLKWQREIAYQLALIAERLAECKAVVELSAQVGDDEQEIARRVMQALTVEGIVRV